MFLYHYLWSPDVLRLPLYVPIPGTAEGLLPRLAFGPVTKTAWIAVSLSGASIHSAEDPMLLGTPFVFSFPIRN